MLKAIKKIKNIYFTIIQKLKAVLSLQQDSSTIKINI